MKNIAPELLESSDTVYAQSDLNIEEIMKLNPDVILYNAGNSSHAEILKASGIPSIGFATVGASTEADPIERYEEWLKLLEQIFNEPGKTDAFVAAGDEIVADVEARIAEIPQTDRPSALILWKYADGVPQVSGQGTFGTYWMKRLGVTDKALEATGFAQASMEQIYSWDPDILFLDGPGLQPLRTEDVLSGNVDGADFSTLTAVKGELDTLIRNYDAGAVLREGVDCAIVGRPNAGKSTLLNRLTSSAIPANNRLFDTLDTTSRLLTVSDTMDVVVSDTVGFIRKLPHQLVEAFKATLEELEYADLLLHVIDVSNPEWQHQAEVVEKLIVELGANEIPRIDVFNKCDRVEAGDLRPHGADICSISARTGEGVDRLLEMIDRRLDKGTRRVTIHLPYDKGGLLDMLYREAKVESVEYSETIDIVAVCPPKVLGQIGDYTPDWTPPKEDWE